MNKQEIKHGGQGRLFDNPYLEYMTRAPARVSAGVYIVILVALLYTGYAREVVGSFLAGLAIFCGAVFFWTFFEYFFHRYINHIDEYFPESKWAGRVAYIIHGIHHEYPRDKERLIMPPIPGLLIVAVLYLVFLSFLGELVYVFMPGFMTGYLLYTFVHFQVHNRKVPSFLSAQHRHHALHHYKYPERAFGVSTTLWDRVFRTMPPDEQVTDDRIGKRAVE